MGAFYGQVEVKRELSGYLEEPCISFIFEGQETGDRRWETGKSRATKPDDNPLWYETPVVLERPL